MFPPNPSPREAPSWGVYIMMIQVSIGILAFQSNSAFDTGVVYLIICIIAIWILTSAGIIIVMRLISSLKSASLNELWIQIMGPHAPSLFMFCLYIDSLCSLALNIVNQFDLSYDLFGIDFYFSHYSLKTIAGLILVYIFNTLPSIFPIVMTDLKYLYLLRLFIQIALFGLIVYISAINILEHDRITAVGNPIKILTSLGAICANNHFQIAYFSILVCAKQRPLKQAIKATIISNLIVVIFTAVPGVLLTWSVSDTSSNTAFHYGDSAYLNFGSDKIRTTYSVLSLISQIIGSSSFIVQLTNIANSIYLSTYNVRMSVQILQRSGASLLAFLLGYVAPRFIRTIKLVSSLGTMLGLSFFPGFLYMLHYELKTPLSIISIITCIICIFLCVIFILYAVLRE